MLDFWVSDVDPWISSDDIWLPSSVSVTVTLDCLAISLSISEPSEQVGCQWEAPLLGASLVVQAPAVSSDCSIVTVDFVSAEIQLRDPEISASSSISLDSLPLVVELNDPEVEISSAQITDIEIDSVSVQVFPQLPSITVDVEYELDLLYTTIDILGFSVQVDSSIQLDVVSISSFVFDSFCTCDNGLFLDSLGVSIEARDFSFDIINENDEVVSLDRLEFSFHQLDILIRIEEIREWLYLTSPVILSQLISTGILQSVDLESSLTMERINSLTITQKRSILTTGLDIQTRLFE